MNTCTCNPNICKCDIGCCPCQDEPAPKLELKGEGGDTEARAICEAMIANIRHNVAQPSAPVESPTRKYQGDDLCEQELHYFMKGRCTACGTTQPVESPEELPPLQVALDNYNTLLDEVVRLGAENKRLRPSADVPVEPPTQRSDYDELVAAYPDVRIWEHAPGDWQVAAGFSGEIKTYGHKTAGAAIATAARRIRAMKEVPADVPVEEPVAWMYRSYLNIGSPRESWELSEPGVTTDLEKTQGHPSGHGKWPLAEIRPLYLHPQSDVPVEERTPLEQLSSTDKAVKAKYPEMWQSWVDLVNRRKEFEKPVPKERTAEMELLKQADGILWRIQAVLYETEKQEWQKIRDHIEGKAKC